MKARVIALRDEYKKVFIGLIDDLPLRKGVDRRRYLRLTSSERFPGRFSGSRRNAILPPR
jgi:hypothetical protein